ncbi:unnamed protein product [Allacma fusca]|uniref:Odorant receptor n=1 Tax=Allacma fusca TaxID=39272 RepID=A0A8J2PDF0_9HEXA|nr:unnamed protein product [Allacma fusca]
MVWFVGIVFVLVVSSFQKTINTVNELAELTFQISYHTCAIFLFHYFRRSRAKLQEIFKEWQQIKMHFSVPDCTLRFEVNLIVGVIMGAALLENIGYNDYYHRIFPPNDEPSCNYSVSFLNPWETNYVESHRLWSNLIPFSLVSGILVDISNKLVVFTFTYMDLTIVVFSRALYFKFLKLKELAEQALVEYNIRNADIWHQYIKDYQTLCLMLKRVNGFLSVLIFCSFGMNSFDLCNQVQFTLIRQPDPSYLRKLYNIWSFFLLLARLYIVNQAGAKVHLWANAAVEVFSKCPREIYYELEIERIERYVYVNPIALNGLGCFIVTKPLLLRIIGVIFTVVIVLLQATQLPKTVLGG